MRPWHQRSLSQTSEKHYDSRLDSREAHQKCINSLDALQPGKEGRKGLLELAAPYPMGQLKLFWLQPQ